MTEGLVTTPSVAPSTFLSEVARSAQDELVGVCREDQLIGVVGLQNLEPPSQPQSASLAIVLEPAARGRGLGREAVRLLLQRARRQGLRRVWLEVRRENVGAIRAYEAAGFCLEEDLGGVLRYSQVL